jgi:tetratricopeptide (TPR) repeat protein
VYAWSNLGAVYDQLGKPYEAIRAYKRSLEEELRQPVVLVNLATIYLNQERWDTARRTLQKAIDMDPQLSAARERMGYCLWREQKLDPAAESYKRAVELDPKNPAAHAGYGVVLMTMYLDHPEKAALRDDAVEAWHRSLEINPDQPKLRALVERYRVKQERPVLSLDVPDISR